MITSSLLVVLLIAQFVAAFVYLWWQDRGVYLHDIRVFFLLCFALYTLFWPITMVGLGTVEDDSAFSQTVLAYNLAVFGFNLVLFVNHKKWPTKGDFDLDAGKKNFWLGIVFLFFLVAYSFYFMYSRGVPVFAFSSFNLDRLDYFQNVDQLWVILKFIIASAASYLIFYLKKLDKMQRIALISIIVFYVLYQASLGNRNEYALIVFFTMGYFLAARKKPVSLKILLVLFVLFVSSFWITIMRSADSRNLRGNQAVELAMQSNEFMYPIQTTYYIIKDKWPHRYGETYTIHVIKQIIPRSWQKDKPQSLGSEFIAKTFGSGWSGWAYTPVTEAYLNFGIVGPFIIYFIIGLIMNSLTTEVWKKGITFKYLMAYSIIFNFCRGDVSSTLYMVLFLWLTYLVMKKIMPSRGLKGNIKNELAAKAQ